MALLAGRGCVCTISQTSKARFRLIREMTVSLVQIPQPLTSFYAEVMRRKEHDHHLIAMGSISPIFALAATRLDSSRSKTAVQRIQKSFFASRFCWVSSASAISGSGVNRARSAIGAPARSGHGCAAG